MSALESGDKINYLTRWGSVQTAYVDRVDGPLCYAENKHTDEPLTLVWDATCESWAER